MHEMCKNKILQYTKRVIYLPQNLKKGGNSMEILKEFRESIKLTQNEFAKSIGVSTSFYIKIELRFQKAKQRIYN